MREPSSTGTCLVRDMLHSELSARSGIFEPSTFLLQARDDVQHGELNTEECLPAFKSGRQFGTEAGEVAELDRHQDFRAIEDV